MQFIIEISIPKSINAPPLVKNNLFGEKLNTRIISLYPVIEDILSIIVIVPFPLKSVKEKPITHNI